MSATDGYGLRLFTAKALSDRLCCSPQELHRLRKDDATFPRPFQRRAGGDPVWDERDVLAWVEARKSADAPTQADEEVGRAAARKALERRSA